MTNPSEAPSPRRQKVQAAEVGTDILKALAELAPSTSLSKLAGHLDMPASKVHRYLQALIASGFAEQDPRTNHYGLGQAALFVGLAALGRLDVVKIAAPALTALRDEVGETCFLAVWANQGPTVVLVEQAVRAVTLVTQVGSVLPLLGSSTGLVFNTFLPDADTRALRQEALRLPVAPTREDLQKQADRLRETGIQPVQGLLMAGVNALSAPLFGVAGRLAGVLTVVGAAPDFSADPDGAVAEHLRHAARGISQRLGG
ncbi:MAG: IclR family transcriptional regulator [Pseudomonas oryzihabitans]